MSEINGKLIVLEGGDGSGKTTQVELLLKRLGNAVTAFDFPRYEISRAGALVGECLSGKHGDFRNLSPYLASLPYMLDRAVAKDDLLRALQKTHVLCDRYTPSNIAYQAAKLSLEKQDAFIEFLETVEYGELGLPRPALVIYLYVPEEIAYRLVGEKKKRAYLAESESRRDQHEADREYQRTVIDVYERLGKIRPDWRIIDCTKDGALLSPESIHERVFGAVYPMLRLQ